MSPFQVFLTRPAGRNGAVPGRLRAAAFDVHELPALELRPVPVIAFPDPSEFDLIVFVSRYAVQRFFAEWRTRSREAAWPVTALAGAVGASTASALRAEGVPVTRLVHPPADVPAQDSEALVQLLDARGHVPRRVLIARGTEGRAWLSETLAARGAVVRLLPLYERVPAPWSATAMAAVEHALQSHAAECVFLLTSSEGVRALAARLREKGLLQNWSRCAFVIIHERIGATLQSELAPLCTHEVTRLALCTPDDDAIVEAIHAVARPTAEP